MFEEKTMFIYDFLFTKLFCNWNTKCDLIE